MPVKSVSHKKPVIIEIGIGKIYDWTAKTHVFKSEKKKKEKGLFYNDL